MPAMIIFGDKTSQVPSASAQGDNLWVSLSDLKSATGWELKPEGLCQGDLCVPLPPPRRAEFVRPDHSFNLAEFARLRDQAVVHDDAHAVWFFGEAPDTRRTGLLSLDAPDFTLPDIDGKKHSLSDYRGQKVLLLSWASW
jgi:hypothetical protein